MLGMAIHTLGQQYSYLRPKTARSFLPPFSAYADHTPVHHCLRSLRLYLPHISGCRWRLGRHRRSSDPPTPRTPTNIMVVGIVFQLVSMIIFSYLAFDFMLRAMQRRPYPGRHQQDGVEMQSSMPGMGGKEYGSGAEREYGYGQGVRGFRNEELVRGWKFVMIGTGICSLMIIIRGIYRSVELVQGWEGHLITHEVYQDTLDGIPMTLALAAVAVFHPTFYLPRRQSWQKA
ncbi:hypothetical protein L202_06880 [Cryptococcus amylolentus CBS 6039]|uniref:Uncharacterized protein n=2 Tax=Cryptococcus amylolentus TaxID=104669 RepID=A0A1E3HGF7_9TREE|nr:hypothetical protein L202_06880 [Cryptococcus amylolentus CBS 6039]ODN74501.1 hypothetical protein L202_06880 [Cryptococcus amylolentus CBS 6039]